MLYPNIAIARHTSQAITKKPSILRVLPPAKQSLLLSALPSGKIALKLPGYGLNA
jgi:hypothetical protein